MHRAAATAKYVRRDVAAGADMVLHVGDIAYANGRSDVWDSFMDAIEPAASRVPYMVAVGERLRPSSQPSHGFLGPLECGSWLARAGQHKLLCLSASISNPCAARVLE